MSVAPYSGSTVPTGTVTFQDGSVVLGSATLNNSGNASFTINTASAGARLLLPVGANTLYASYSGDGNYTAAISSGVPVQVGSASPQTQLTSGIITTLNGTNNVSAIFLTVDMNGNVYYATLAGVYVIASGSGKIPGVSNPAGGTTYTVVSTFCSGNTPCNVPGPAANAGIGNVYNIQVDAASNVYILANSGNGIFRIDAQTDAITQITPAPTPALGDAPASSPALSSSIYNFYLDNAGNIYLADDGNYDVARVDAITGVMTLVAGTPGVQCPSSTTACGDGGPSTSASLYGGGAIYLDAAGNLYTIDQNAIRKIDAKTGIISTIAGTFGVPCPASTSCGDGGPATQALFNNPDWVTGDAAGNLYIADENDAAVREIDTQGNISTIAGTVLQQGNGTGVGDNGLATNAQLYLPSQMAFGPQGDLYIATGGSGGDPIREVTAATTAFTYSAGNVGPSGSQTAIVANTSTLPLHVTGITATTGFVQQPVGNNDCTGSDTIAPGGFCTLGIAFYPPASGTTTGSVSIADDSGNATAGANVITLSGTASNGTQANTITFAPLPDVTYGGASSISLNATASSGNAVSYSVTGPAVVSGNQLTIKGAGKVTVTAYQFGDGTYKPATPVPQSFTVMPAVLTVTASSFSCPAGQIASCLTSNPLAYAVTGFINGDTSSVVSGTATLTTTVTVNSGAGAYPITFATENLAAANYTFTYVPGTVTVSGGEAQTITFGALPGVTYGASTINLNATASSGLPVSYTVTGPATISGSALFVNGAGVVTVTAQQSGDATFAAAPPIPQSFAVNKAALTVTANNQTVAQGNTPGNFTATYTGFVNGENSSVITGSPAFTTSASASSPVGTQTLNISQGTLAAANYSFTFVSGTITIVAGTPQTITFTPVPNLTYGVGPVSLIASSTSGLPVSYKVSGPGTLSGSTLNIIGAGTVIVTASQPGQGIYSAASPVSQTIAVAPAVLTATANNVTRVNNVPNPAFTATLTGFVNGDSSTAVGGAPNFSTTALPGSPVGAYPINLASGNLTAANYVFTTAAGTLTITSGGPAPDYSITASPQVLTVSPGYTQQTTLSLSPSNYFLGTVSLSCGNLPANVTCIFTPAAFSVDGTGNVPNYVTLTINTNSGSPVLSERKRPSDGAANSRMLACFLFPVGGLFFLLPLGKRLRRGGGDGIRLIAFLIAMGSVVALGGCGSKNNSGGQSGLAAPGTSMITVTAMGTSSNSTSPISNSLQLTLTVAGQE